MNVRPPLIAHSEPPVSVQPSQRPFHHPAMTPQFLTAFHSPPSNPGGDTPCPERTAAGSVIIPLVSMQFVGTITWVTPPSAVDRRYRVYRRRQHLAVMDISSRQNHRKWRSLPVYHNIALRSLFASIRRIRPGLLAPFLASGAATEAESKQARDQSSWSAWANLSSKVACNSSQTPACCQSRRRRQHVMPEPHPISWGSISQGMPVISTNKMPRRASRSASRGLPPLGLGGSGGKSGATKSQSSSETSGFAITHKDYHIKIRFC
jgi:hypothetical protein